RSGRFKTGEVVQEALADGLAVACVRHLRMELHRSEPASAVLKGSDRRAVGARRDREPLRRVGHTVAVTHPHGLLLRQSTEERTSAGAEPKVGATELPLPGMGHRPPETLCHGLEAVAAAEDRPAS